MRDTLPPLPSGAAALPYYLFRVGVAQITNPPAFRGVTARVRNAERRLGRLLTPDELVAILKQWAEE